MRSRELESIIFMRPYQLEIFHDSMILCDKFHVNNYGAVWGLVSLGLESENTEAVGSGQHVTTSVVSCQ